MADKAISDLTAASALNDADLLLITQSATSKKLTGAALKTYAQDGFTVSSSSTLTNKTINLTNNVLSGTLAQFNTALSDADFVTIAGAETLTSKSLTTPILTATASGTTAGRLGYLSGALTFGDGTTQQSILTTVGNTWTFANSTTLSAASTKTLTLNGGGGSNGLVLDASNNVGIGTSSPAAKADVAGTVRSTSQTAPSSGTGAELFYDSTNAGLRGYNRTGSAYVTLALNDNIYVDGGSSGNVKINGNLGLGVTPFSTNGKNLHIKSTSAPARLILECTDTSGHLWFQQSSPNGSVNWYDVTTSKQAMTLDASGNLLVGSTSPITGFASQISSTGPGTNRGSLNLGRTTAATSGVCGTILAINGANAVCGMDLQANGANNSGYIGTYTYNAGVYAQGPYVNTGGTSWTTASDERLKNIFGVIDNALEKTNSLRAIEYTLKSDDSNIERVGLVAQEVQKVLPQAVNEDTEGYLGVQYTDIVPLLVGAIQELSAELNELKQKVNA